uniref:Uncharacterized protein n=1 Tax=Daucus carota subsp. sativus TaxID=79200 RepID=A0A162B3D1_DAUCS
MTISRGNIFENYAGAKSEHTFRIINTLGFLERWHDLSTPYKRSFTPYLDF